MAKTTSISDDEPIRFEKKPRQKVRIRVFRTSPQQFFEEGFRKIAATRMKGVPICNPRLSVSSVPFRKVDGQWVGGVVTPWSLLVIRACGDPETWTNIAETKVKGVELPGGEFSFMGVVDPDLGVYQSCSLLSPTWEIGDQPTVEAVVRISLDTMLSPPDPNKKEPEPELGEPLTVQKPLSEIPEKMTRRQIVIRAVEAPDAGRK